MRQMSPGEAALPTSDAVSNGRDGREPPLVLRPDAWYVTIWLDILSLCSITRTETFQRGAARDSNHGGHFSTVRLLQGFVRIQSGLCALLAQLAFEKWALD